MEHKKELCKKLNHSKKRYKTHSQIFNPDTQKYSIF